VGALAEPSQQSLGLPELSNIPVDGKTLSTDEVQTTRGKYPIHVAFGVPHLTKDIWMRTTSALRLFFFPNAIAQKKV
jgi:hypothetical protein